MIDIDIWPDDASQSLCQLVVPRRIKEIFLVVHFVVWSLLQLDDVEHIITVLNAFESYSFRVVIEKLLTQHHAELNLMAFDELHILRKSFKDRSLRMKDNGLWNLTFTGRQSTHMHYAPHTDDLISSQHFSYIISWKSGFHFWRYAWKSRKIVSSAYRKALSDSKFVGTLLGNWIVKKLLLFL